MSVDAGGKETQHDVWKYNGALDKWIQIEVLTTGRWRHKMAVHGGKVYALGGFDGVQRLASVEAYDPFHNRWTQVNMQEFCNNFVLLSSFMSLEGKTSEGALGRSVFIWLFKHQQNNNTIK